MLVSSVPVGNDHLRNGKLQRLSSGNLVLNQLLTFIPYSNSDPDLNPIIIGNVDHSLKYKKVRDCYPRVAGCWIQDHWGFT